MINPINEAFQFFKKYPGHLKTATSEIAERLNVSEEAVTKGRAKYRNYRDEENHKKNQESSESQKENTNENEVSGSSPLYSPTLKEYCEDIGLDYEKVDPENDVKYWMTTRGEKRYTIVPKTLTEDDFDPVEAFKKEIKEYQPKDYSHLFNKPTPNKKKRIAFLNLFDAHIDKICSLDTTDSEASIQKNIAEFEEAFDELLNDVANKGPERIVIPFGNDFFQTNDFTLTTKKGTNQADKVHVTGHQAFRIGVDLLRKCVDKARSIAPVVLLPIRGNHDEDRVRYLLECLLIAYENQDDVKVRDTRRARVYLQYGTWLFGFAHGDKGIKLKEYPQLMSTDKESRKFWSMIDQGVFFLGHVHHEKRYEYLKGKDFRGCKMEVLRATSPMDEWHWEEGWTAIPRTGYAFVYDKDGKREHELKVTI